VLNKRQTPADNDHFHREEREGREEKNKINNNKIPGEEKREKIKMPGQLKFQNSPCPP